jgi:hypothetical protein
MSFNFISKIIKGLKLIKKQGAYNFTISVETGAELIGETCILEAVSLFCDRPLSLFSFSAPKLPSAPLKLPFRFFLTCIVALLK